MQKRGELRDIHAALGVIIRRVAADPSGGVRRGPLADCVGKCVPLAVIAREDVAYARFERALGCIGGGLAPIELEIIDCPALLIRRHMQQPAHGLPPVFIRNLRDVRCVYEFVRQRGERLQFLNLRRRQFI